MTAWLQRPTYTARSGESIKVFRTAEANFAIGAGRVTIMRSDPGFVVDVVADLDRLVRTPEGEAALRAGDALGRAIRVVKLEVLVDPPNAWTIPDSLAAACAAGAPLGRGPDGAALYGTGAGCGSTIVYDPAAWPQPGDPASPTSHGVLLLMLRQANLNARGAGDPAKPNWGADEEGER